jgi:hypothetical protein
VSAQEPLATVCARPVPAETLTVHQIAPANPENAGSWFALGRATVYGGANCGHFWVVDYVIPDPLPGIAPGATPLPFQIAGTPGNSAAGQTWLDLASITTPEECATLKIQTLIWGYANGTWTTLADQTITGSWYGYCSPNAYPETTSVQSAYAYETYRVAVTAHATVNGALELFPVESWVGSY